MPCRYNISHDSLCVCGKSGFSGIPLVVISSPEPPASSGRYESKQATLGPIIKAMQQRGKGEIQSTSVINWQQKAWGKPVRSEYMAGETGIKLNCHRDWIHDSL